MTKKNRASSTLPALGAAALLILSACASPMGSSAAGGGVGPTVSSAVVADAAKRANVAGQYKGTAIDKSLGKGTVIFNQSQSGTAAGGSLDLRASGKVYKEVVAWSLSSANTLTGNSIATIGNSACTFSITGTYNAKTFMLTGSYKASHGCTGDSGSFTTKEQCYYVHSSDVRAQGATSDASHLSPC